METRGDPDDFMPIYNALPQDEPLFKTVRDVIENLKSDKIVGKHLKREQIPKYYLKKHDVNAVYKVDLPGYWRLIYGITAIHGEKMALLMELFDHEKYNKRFGY
ncbi:MAG: hypothetical protein ACREAN_02245 [Nitrosopumilaceae archaeon]